MAKIKIGIHMLNNKLLNNSALRNQRFCKMKMDTRANQSSH